jgi:type 1 glutamine amidotransferase
MQGNPYKRPPYPSTWARLHGQGRVFYTSMAHRDENWASARFQNILLGALAWTTRNVDADVTPNIEQATPGAWELPPQGA